MQKAQGSVRPSADFRPDLTRGCLNGPDGSALLLGPKAFDLPWHLLRDVGRLISPEELMQAVWPEVTVMDNSITRCIAEGIVLITAEPDGAPVSTGPAYARRRKSPPVTAAALRDAELATP
ncbi:transcriptional regulator [Roseomonas sp. GCM10028921]